MNIKLTEAPLTLAVVRYPRRGGACLGGSILADRPSRMIRAFEVHHARFGVVDDAPMRHLTISAPRGVKLTARAWRATLSATLRDLGTPMHQLVWVAYRHLRAATDHVHMLFSRYTIHGVPIVPNMTRDLYELGNRLSHRLRLPTPFPDIKGGPVMIEAPVRAAKTREREGATDKGTIGSRINQCLSVDRPVTYPGLVASAARHGVEIQKRSYRNGTQGLAYSLAAPKPTLLRDFRPPAWLPGGRIGLQFTLKGILRRLDLLRYLSELPAQLAVKNYSQPRRHQPGRSLTCGRTSMSDEEQQIINLTGSADDAVEALWQLLHRLKEIADRLDPLAEELAQVPQESNLLLKKLFEYLGSLQELSTDTATKVESIQTTIASIRSDQSAQAERMERMEEMLREIHVPLTAHIR